MADLTIKELADQLGVSKDKVKYRVRKLPDDSTYKEGNVTYLTEAAISMIRAEFDEVATESLPSESPVENGDYLKGIIEKKDEQIHQLQEMLKTQQKLVDQQQQLTLHANKQIELLQTQVKELKQPVEIGSSATQEAVEKEESVAADESPEEASSESKSVEQETQSTQAESEKKAGLWARLFKK
ncbi:hypothetical protein RV11_GL000087 [Enterococcus phoeniculicola]|jgi:DNA-binding Lrp family transcriptional regulator|uniref:DUF536 domain-containing protein n=1 Tax=Enterococcus phoeniculicola ATCC BAA-412 TaxID=1158610 RepID=R3WUN4_9ENTE|nr:AsnC family protein [Enterococcus phoeniculicola]EOL45480.1 hypothetical protein UC3_01370 [Enterococcus phoeniculicola ATCC BAA-412]EOT74842.1 hypothetical protein I589_02442 [Enterococcus phoeniculicola ATCC BAA-412]OJG73721.1 hypothetical protein RV11_GL000087 [Enterococcus phoeniculicola]